MVIEDYAAFSCTRVGSCELQGNGCGVRADGPRRSTHTAEVCLLVSGRERKGAARVASTNW